MSESIEDTVAVNKGKKGAGAKKAKKSGGKKRHRKAAAKTSGKRRRRSAAPAPKHRRRSRRKNPGVDIMGMGVAALGGAAAEVVTTVGAHFAGKLVKKDGLGRSAVKAGAGGVLGIGLGTVVGMFSPSAGKGMAGVGGSQIVRHLLAEAAISKDGKANVLQKAGFAIKTLPEGVYAKDGVLYKLDAAGKEQLLLGFSPRAIELEMDDGSRRPAQLLGQLGNDALILDQEGEVRMLAGVVVDAYPNPQAIGGGQGTIVPAYQGGDGLSGNDYSEDRYS
ncbi:MAG: hypothetical protein WC969_15245 [Elusimicrobiota bacterium]|jgi:hypothetical protein